MLKTSLLHANYSMLMGYSFTVFLSISGFIIICKLAYTVNYISK
jgi:hypothetical protein